MPVCLIPIPQVIPVGLISDPLCNNKKSHFGKGPLKKKQKTKDQKKNQAKSDRPTFLFFFKVPLLSAMRVGCGHATAYGHLQLAAGSSFTS
jgi:hypothetical protein